MHFTSKTATSSWGLRTTNAQTTKVNYQHITSVWHCNWWGAPSSQVWWRLHCSPSKCCWRSQHSSTPNNNDRGSQLVHAGNRIHKDSMAIHFQWEVLDSWRGLETSHWSPGLSAGISSCFCRYNICVLIAQWSISQNWSSNPRCWRCLCCFLLIDWTYDDTNPQQYMYLNLNISSIRGLLQIELVDILSVVTGSICNQRPNSESTSVSSCSTMLIARRVSILRNHGLPGWKCLTQSRIDHYSPLIAWGDNRPNRRSFNLSHGRP